MSDIHTRADALKALLSGETCEGAIPPLAEAAVAVCEELLLVGGASAVLELVELARHRRAELTSDAALRLDIAHITALRSMGTNATALECVRRVRTEFASELRENPELLDRLEVAEGGCLWGLNRADDAVALLSRVRNRRLAGPDSALLAQCGIELSSAHWFLGEQALASQLALDALVSARRAGSKYYEAVALTACAIQARRECKWTEAGSSLREALAILDELGNDYQAHGALRGLALLNLKRGHLDVALQFAERCLSKDAKDVTPRLRGYGRLIKALVMIHMGEVSQAQEAIRDLPPWGTAGEARAGLLASEYLGDIQLEQGDVSGALARYEDVYTKALAIAPKGDIVGDIHVRRAECHLLMGRAEEAYTEAKVALEHWRGMGERYEEAATYRVLALSAAAVGKPDEAKSWFDQGFAYYDDIETPYEWGRLWMAYGDWLIGPHAGAYADRNGALEAYRAARDHFERIGAEAKLGEAEARLVRHAPPREAAPVVPGGAVVKDARATPRRPRRATDLARRSAWAFETFRLITRNRGMLALLDDVAKLATSDTPMLVLGESGTGKELIARGIHALSGRKGAYMALNAGALPREIIESELFGHIAGAFTGALRDKPGIFEVCHKGTVFLDEIAEMSIELQSRLLRVLETGESRRVGANANIAVDTRIVAATNRPQQELQRGGKFRNDLYYRLAHAVISLPPLRHRGDDIELLLDRFLEEACAGARRHVRLSPAARKAMTDYAWPGNVRQLRAVVKRIVVLAPDGHEVAPGELELDNADVPTSLSEELEIEERRILEDALARADGSRTEAAKMLGMPRTTLINKIRRYRLG